MLATNIIQLTIPSIKDYIKLHGGGTTNSGRITKWSVDIFKKRIDFAFLIPVEEADRFNVLSHKGAVEFTRIDMNYQTSYVFEKSKKELICILSGMMYHSGIHGYLIEGNMRLHELMDQVDFQEFDLKKKLETPGETSFEYLDLE